MGLRLKHKENPIPVIIKFFLKLARCPTLPSKKVFELDYFLIEK
jgi:hypothetical protein